MQGWIMKIRVYPFGPVQSTLYVILFHSDAIIIDPCVRFDRLGLDGINVRGIICTHSHYDHVVEVESIRAITHSPLFAYKDEVESIFSADKNRSSLIFPVITISPPVFGLNDGDILTAKDFDFVTDDAFTLRIIHTPGHTSGSMCILLTGKGEKGEEKYLFSGDTLFAGTVGRTDIGGNMHDMKRSIKILSALSDDIVVLPGHGQSTTIGIERRVNPYFTGINCDDII
jgi:glyoxylase-like metal-dependent hydrolase (beta-lactamase superfamily II)